MYACTCVRIHVCRLFALVLKHYFSLPPLTLPYIHVCCVIICTYMHTGKGFICGTPVVSDGETMGWNGMKYSLVSRDWIADCVEMMAEAYAVVRKHGQH